MLLRRRSALVRRRGRRPVLSRRVLLRDFEAKFKLLKMRARQLHYIPGNGHVSR
jgi:hypothetical protein